MALTETWLYESHREAEVKIPGYEFFRRDRLGKKKKGVRASGGVGIYVRDDAAISTEEIFSFSKGSVEALGIRMDDYNLIIVTIYRSPSSDESEFSALLSKLRPFLASLTAPTPDILILGDLNFPNADWDVGEAKPPASTEEQNMVSALFSLACDNFLVQQVDQPTHRAGNTLDLVFTNNGHLISDLTCSPAPISDHFLVDATLPYKTQAAPTGVQNTEEPPPPAEGFWALNFHSEDADWDGLTAALSSHNWRHEFRQKNSDDCLNQFLDVCKVYSSQYIPLRPKKGPAEPQATTKPSREKRLLLRKRCRLKKRYFSEFRPAVKEAISRQLIDNERKIQRLTRAEKNKKENSAISKIKSNPKYFFSYAKSLSKVKVGIGPLISNRDKTLVTSPKLMAEILSAQYASVFTSPSAPDVEFPSDETQDPDQPQYQISASHVKMLKLLYMSSQLHPHLVLMAVPQSC